ncbi:MAG: phage tail tape measure protein [Methanophagales archaeon]|nr:phage tail tape measure protein [Methanophagales archaeon]
MPIIGFGGEMALRTAVTLGNKQFLQSIDQMERKMSGFTSFMHRSSLKFAAGAGLITAGLGLSIKAAANFEQAMANMDSVANTTGEEFERLRQLAFNMSKTTTRSATEAATAMYELASSGQRAEQIYSTLPAVIKLADATQYDLSQTTSTVVSTLNAFGLEASQTERLVNVFAATIGGSLAKMDKLQASFAYIGPVAKAAGMSVEETAASLMVLYNAGLDGSAAGTTLRRILAALLNPTESLTKRINDLGLDISAVDPRMHSMTEIMMTLREAGLDATAAFEDFGLRGAPGLLALLEAGEDIDEFQRQITGTDKASEMLARQMETLAAQGKILKNSLVTIGIKIGEKLLPMARDLVSWLQRLMDRFDGLSDSAIELGAKLALVAGGGLGALSMIGRLAPVLGAAAGPIGILTIAVAALAAAWVLADQTMGDYYDALREGNLEEAQALQSKAEWAAMMKAAFDPEYWKAVGSDIFIFFQRLGSSLSAFFETIGNDAKKLGEAFDPRNWFNEDWRRTFAEGFKIDDIGQIMGEAWENAPVDLPPGAQSWTQAFYDKLFTPPAETGGAGGGPVAKAIQTALEGVDEIAVPTAAIRGKAAELATFWQQAMDEEWDQGQIAKEFNERFGLALMATDRNMDLIESRHRQMVDNIRAEMEFAGELLVGFMQTVGAGLGEAMEKEKVFAHALVKTIGKAYADLVEKFAMKAVTNTLMAQAETVGILSMEGLFNPAAWAKLAPAIAKGAATIALIKAIKGKLGFHTGGAPYGEGWKWVKSDELIMDRPTVQRGGYGRATLDAADMGGLGGGINVTVMIQQAVVKDPEQDGRRLGRVIGEELTAVLSMGG